ncbi:MAG: hypothetical protein A3I10_07445 [Deltaproteobacteria bacterium RIFCSPLOWO2_02_FULL_57_26]|nr:MAG: hypothetical protein A3I10_07445 [Deltaproteobacteria bacterium RIFCSPLOWO2_02_FULL_57_26]OGQ76974.1 MAG: hypothetical protein A3G40_00620 [Deltaproteobacteria bacterium RIFCSPLOWO2_12_FULL_57_22]
MENVKNGKKTILVVDDSTDFVDVVKKMLEVDGYAVECVYSGAEAFKRLEVKRPDLIVLDIMMPEMDGLEVLARLKGANDTSSIPVILVTAKDQHRDILAGYQMGGDYYITKPFSSGQLISGIDLLLSSDHS